MHKYVYLRNIFCFVHLCINYFSLLFRQKCSNRALTSQFSCCGLRDSYTLKFQLVLANCRIILLLQFHHLRRTYYAKLHCTSSFIYNCCQIFTKVISLIYIINILDKFKYQCWSTIFKRVLPMEILFTWKIAFMYNFDKFLSSKVYISMVLD